MIGVELDYVSSNAHDLRCFSIFVTDLILSPFSFPGAHVPPAPDDEARQESLRHHQRHRTGAPRAGM